MDFGLPVMKNKTVMILLQFQAAILSFSAFHAKSSQRFLEAQRRRTTESAVFHFFLFCVSGPPRNAAKYVNI